MIDNYKALTLGTYMRVNEVLESEAEDLDKQVQIIAILSGKTADEVLLLPLADYAQMAAKTAFLREHCKPTEIKEDWQYEDLVPVTDFRQINVAQYIDFQTFSKDFPRSMPELLSVFLVPQGCAYNEQYDVAAVVERVKQLPFADALGLSAFFFREVSTINRGFPNLLGFGDEAYQEQAEEDADAEGDDEEDRGSGGTFTERWGWIANVDRASELLRCPWGAVWQMSAIEWLNVLAYRRDKAEWEKDAVERWKRSH